ncbi:hypothetical protein [Kitasatospora purpeofusca]|uniref:hypothetical protein n=1 Tax=Kitasatospora purpeofusca TaxID=67352 RepID=UPI00369B9A1E
MQVGRPTLADEFNGINSRISTMERQSSAQGEVLAFVSYPYATSQPGWWACGFISTVSLTQPVIRLDMRAAVKAGSTIQLRLFDSDTGWATDPATIHGLNNGSGQAENQWVQLSWAHSLPVGRARKWHRMAVQVAGADSNVTLSPGVALSLPYGQAPEATSGGRWQMIEKPPGFH